MTDIPIIATNCLAQLTKHKLPIIPPEPYKQGIIFRHYYDYLYIYYDNEYLYELKAETYHKSTFYRFLYNSHRFIELYLRLIKQELPNSLGIIPGELA